MKALESPYDVLGVNKWQGPDAFKAAYRKLAVKYHPDKHKDNIKKATDEFIKIKEAYSILSDPKKKELYDKYGTTEIEEVFEDSEDVLTDFVKDFKAGYNKVTNKDRHPDRHDAGFFNKFEADVNTRLPKPPFQEGWLHDVCTKCHGDGKHEEGVGFFMHDVKCETCNGIGWTKKRSPVQVKHYNNKFDKVANEYDGKDGIFNLFKELW